MDPVSQAALGAVVGQAVGHARLGYRAAVVGAFAGALPDVDVLFSISGDYFDQLLRHRGITHSLMFPPLAGPLLGVLVWWYERHRADRTGPAAGARVDRPNERARLGCWVSVVTLALLSHPLLDYLTPYGTQLLLPFSRARFAINAMPIIDPVYTLLLLGGLLASARLWRARARGVAFATLLLSSGYLAYGWAQNLEAERLANEQLASEGVFDARVAAFPTILQVHYRRVVARTPTEDRVGFVSTWRPCGIHWARAPASARVPAIHAFLETREGRIFDWFAMGWARYRLEAGAGALRVRATDLRYGFTDDPDRSIFTASALVDLAGRIIGPVRAGRDAAEATGARLSLLFRDTYRAECTAARAPGRSQVP